MKTLTRLWIAAILALAAPAAAQSVPETAALVHGQAVTGDQVLAAAAADLQALDASRPRDERARARERLRILHNALDAIAAEQLVALEAAALQTTPAQIIEAEITSNVAVPSDDEVAAAYEKNKANINGPRDEALAGLRRQMTDRSRNTYRDALLRRLKRQYGFKSFLEPLRADVATAGYPSRGPMTAPVTIVEFSDFECPFCGGLFPTLQAIEEAYPDTVRVVYRQFPLTSIHPHAQKAAEASLCASEQGRFWEMHDSLFGRQDDLTVDALKRRAMDLRLDVDAFGACLDSGKHVETIRKDKEDASSLGVTGTPTLFVNGRMLLGNQPAELRLLIEDELARR